MSGVGCSETQEATMGEKMLETSIAFGNRWRVQFYVFVQDQQSNLCWELVKVLAELLLFFLDFRSSAFRLVDMFG